jgi:CDP-diacylglycerol--serine O-phosphatidyltransferase
MFVLPTLFTVSSIFCGFYAVVLVSDSAQPDQIYRAALAILFGMFFDGADGRVARMTRTQSDFGVQMDSLADVITFGVAPAAVVYRWGISGLDILGVIVAFIYVGCGAIRLARFNVLATRSPGGARFFVGLPIPLAAGVLMTLVMFHQRTYAAPPTRVGHILVLMLVLSYLMVSNVRYRTFKHVKLSRKSLSAVLTLVLVFALIAARVKPTFALLAFVAGYVGLGLIEEVVFFRRRRQEERPAESSSLNGTP